MNTAAHSHFARLPSRIQDLVVADARTRSAILTGTMILFASLGLVGVLALGLQKPDAIPAITIATVLLVGGAGAVRFLARRDLRHPERSALGAVLVGDPADVTRIQVQRLALNGAELNFVVAITRRSGAFVTLPAGMSERHAFTLAGQVHALFPHAYFG